jgi:Beta/Gamma crystallin
MQATPLRCRLSAGAVLAVLLVAAPARAEVVLYEHDRFNGRTITVTESLTDLRVQEFNDKASSVVIRKGRWQLCADINFRGSCKDLGPGEYPSLSAMGFNDKLSSLRKLVGDGRSPIELFEHIHYEGRSLGLAAATTNLTQANYNDKVSSIVVRSGRWELCTDADFRGRCFALDAGEYPDLTQRGLNDMISSVRPVGQQTGSTQGRQIKTPR